MRMTRSSPILRPAGFVVALMLIVPASAQSAVYRCVDKDGHVTYTDISGTNCTVIESSNAGAISTPAVAPRSPAVTMRQGASRPAAAAPTASPAAFPRVDNATQRARDEDRREILGEELRAEEKKLADLKRDFNNGEPERQGNEKNYAKYQERVAQMRIDIGRAEKNVEAIKREIANIH